LHAFYHLDFERFLAPEFPLSLVSDVLGMLYNFVPGVFLFCLGCGAVLTRRNTPEAFARRGRHLILLGLVLNLLRFTPFYLIKGLALGDMAGFSRAWLWLIGSDVLPFAGMSFLCFAGMKRCRFPDWAVLCFGLACAAGQMLLPVPRMDGMAGHLLGNFLFVDGGASYFPFLSWMVYPCLGYFYQSRLSQTRHPARFHLVLGAVCGSLLAASVLLLKHLGKWKKRYLFWGEMEFRMDLPTTWFAGLIGGVWVSAAYFLSLLKCPAGKWISAFSRRVTSFYCVHWLILMYGLLLGRLVKKPAKMRSIGAFAAAGTALVLVSAILTKYMIPKSKRT
ncbi:MAG: DUF1624 domain-containing protein, partial [Clostridia bacterium]|nr:DUF1624 domain-containing protein [Clostridia bacterium]